MQFEGTITDDILTSIPDWTPYRAAVAPQGATPEFVEV